MLRPKGLAESVGGFPTVLVAALEEPVCRALSQSLRDEGCNVLEAHDWADAFHIVKCHSRPIHLLLTHVGKAIPDLAETLKPYRPELRIMFIAQHTEETLPNVLQPEVALAKIDELFKPLKAASQ